MTTAYHDPIAFGASAHPDTLNPPLGQLDAAIALAITSGSGWSTTLDGTANAGQKVVPVTTTTGAVAGQVVWFRSTGGTTEPAARTIASVSAGVSITLNENLTNTYSAGTLISASPAELVDARGWASSLGGRVGLIESRVFDIRRYGALGGATDDTAADQAAIDAASVAGGTVLFPFLSKVSVVTILAPNVHLLATNGGGILDGTIRVGQDPGGVGIGGVRIEELNFNRSVASSTVNAIELQNVSAVDIVGCRFENYNANVYVVPLTAASHTGRVVIDRCGGEWSRYLLLIPPSLTAGAFTALDTTVRGCVNLSRISAIEVTGADGIVIEGNTFFEPGGWEQDANKAHNVHLTTSAGAIIANNRCFESGLEAILLDRVGPDTTVVGNQITWPGQRVMANAIRVIGGDRNGDRYNNGTISNNETLMPSKHGISVEDVGGNLVVSGNFVRAAGNNPQYYGTPAQDTITHYGLNVTNTTQEMQVVNNLTPTNTNNIVPGWHSRHSGNLDNTGEAEGVTTTTLALTGVINPAITATVNDWAPAGLDTATVIVAVPNAARTITGIAAGVGGRTLFLFNLSAFTLTLANMNAGSAGANQLLCMGVVDLVLPKYGAALLVYSPVNSRWMVLGGIS